MDSHKEIPAGSEFGYIARKLSKIDANIREIKTELKYRPDEPRVREVTDEIITGKIELCKAQHRKDSKTQIPIPPKTLLNLSDWRGILRTILAVISLFSAGAGAGYTVKADDNRVEVSDKE